MSVATLANKTFVFQRATITRDAIGGQVETWANVARLRGRVQPLSADDAIRHAKEESLVTHKGYFSGTPDIRNGDRITLSTKIDTTYLHVTGVRNIDFADEFLTVEFEERDQ